MLEEVRKAAPLLEDSRPQTIVVRVDFSSAAIGDKDVEPHRNNEPNVADTAKREFVRETGVQLGDAPELRYRLPAFFLAPNHMPLLTASVLRFTIYHAQAVFGALVARVSRLSPPSQVNGEALDQPWR